MDPVGPWSSVHVVVRVFEEGGERCRVGPWKKRS